MMNLADLKSLNIGGVELKALSIDGVQVWKKLVTLFNGTFPNKTVSGVTFSWDDENKILTMNGTATANIAAWGTYGCTDINLPVGKYKWNITTVGGSYTHNGTRTWFRFGNQSSGANAYQAYIDEEWNVDQTVVVNVFAPRIASGSVFNNLQLQFIVTEA